jgi:hypothetical protein
MSSDLTFKPRVHNGVRMGLRGVDKLLFPILLRNSWVRCLGKFREQTPSIPTVQRPRVWSELGYFWMIGTRTVLDCLDTVVFSLLKFAPTCDLIESNLIH